MRAKKSPDWIPFYVDAWLFGSTRHELIIREGDQTIDLRGVWMDLLILSIKHLGYIEANEKTAYPLEQLAGMLQIPKEMLEKTIKICLSVEKIKDVGGGRYYVPAWEKWAFSSRHIRRIMSVNADTMSEKPDHASAQEDPGEDRIGEDRIGTSPPTPPLRGDGRGAGRFDEFWKAYPKRVHRDDAKDAYNALRKKGVTDKEISAALEGYINHLAREANERGREFKDHLNFSLNPASFLRKNRWKDYVGIKKFVRL